MEDGKALACLPSGLRKRKRGRGANAYHEVSFEFVPDAAEQMPGMPPSIVVLVHCSTSSTSTLTYLAA